MVMGIIFATAPAVTAAAGIYFFESSTSKAHELGSGARASVGGMVEKVKEKMSNKMLKLAPQFDGLNCFETLVGR